MAAKVDNKTPVTLDYSRSHRLLAHPLTLYLFVWGFVVLLYTMHLSGLLMFDNDILFRTVSYIVLPFVAACLVSMFLFSDPIKQGVVQISSRAIEKLDKKLRSWLVVWACVSTFEIIYSGGIPIVWLLRGSGKTYFDFGIHSLHGFANSLLLTIGLCSFALYTKTNEKRYLRVPAFILVWSLMSVTRNLMIVFSIEAALVWELFRGFRRRTLAVAVGAFIALILVFGYVGDMRTGADMFRKLAKPTADYPDWLPSGVLWVYVYMTTPINNLINTSIGVNPLNDPRFPNTTSLLFPSVIRTSIYGKNAIEDATSGNLVTEAFNVSTAYVGPIQDYGFAGVCYFSILLGVLGIYYWHGRSFRSMLIYVVIAQCLLLTVFFNHLFDLPIITQVAWLYLFCDRDVGRISLRADRRAPRPPCAPLAADVGRRVQSA